MRLFGTGIYLRWRIWQLLGMIKANGMGPRRIELRTFYHVCRYRAKTACFWGLVKRSLTRSHRQATLINYLKEFITFICMDFAKLFDSAIVSDFRPIYRGNQIFIRVKRSKYLTRVPQTFGNDLAYLAGVIIGDGNFSLSARKGCAYPRVALRITNQSLPLLKRLNFLFDKYFDYSGHIYKKRNRDYYDLQVNNRIVFLYFNRFLGFKKRKCVITVPPFVFKDPNLARYFLAGPFDTDGYFSRKSFGIMLKGDNYQFLEDIMKFAASIGLYFGKITRSNLVVNDLTYSRVSTVLKRESVKRFWQLIPLMNEKYGPAEDRTPDLRCVRVTRVPALSIKGARVPSTS